MNAGQRGTDRDGARPEPAGGAEAPRGEIRTVDARELLGERGILRIDHGGEIYVLRLTRNDRLILTK
jgi:hemin uptake protein HemP